MLLLCDNFSVFQLIFPCTHIQCVGSYTHVKFSLKENSKWHTKERCKGALFMRNANGNYSFNWLAIPPRKYVAPLEMLLKFRGCHANQNRIGKSNTRPTTQLNTKRKH